MTDTSNEQSSAAGWKTQDYVLETRGAVGKSVGQGFDFNGWVSLGRLATGSGHREESNKNDADICKPR